MAGVENTGSNAVVDQEDHNQHTGIAYPPLPSGVTIKEEPLSDDDQDERYEKRQPLMAYPPLPQVDIKEELETGEGRQVLSLSLI